jgi:hypothetical protein
MKLQNGLALVTALKPVYHYWQKHIFLLSFFFRMPTRLLCTGRSSILFPIGTGEAQIFNPLATPAPRRCSTDGERVTGNY